MNKDILKFKSILNEALLSIRQLDNPLERVNKAISAIENTVLDLNHYLEDHQFINQQEEIEFFKNLKPEILALKIEEVYRYHLSLNKPIGTTENQLKYFEDELHALQTFFRMNAYHYQYFKNNLSELDNLYFLRNAGPLTVPLAEISDIDAEFSTPMTFLFAKFIAYEHIQYYILEKIAGIKFPDFVHANVNSTDDLSLNWTGKQINIVELTYGLFLTGQLNHGNASLNQIVRWMEINLHVNIGIIQRRITEIEGRKRLSITKFIDQMKEAIIKKIEGNRE